MENMVGLKMATMSTVQWLEEVAMDDMINMLMKAIAKVGRYMTKGVTTLRVGGWTPWRHFWPW
ncbi:hypothetical protein RchiOBHm_Chr2g0096411 [Rosa chinensis]|uniref:Uncharacterized protein n=1 Tax=Rosa chinensis TaxID=74649 RepID=A0A2P6RL34_ROSCH|nr:hypothetical protein RchiOBHm_Chr2g0096411 [Rosa chinensis]